MPTDVFFLFRSLIIQVLLWSHAPTLAINLATLLQAWNIVCSVFVAMPSIVEVLSHRQTPTATWLVVAIRKRSAVLATD